MKTESRKYVTEHGDTCEAEGCERPYYAKRYCKMHVQRMDRNGTLERLTTDPSMPMKARLKDRSQWVGDCLEWTGYRDQDGYGDMRANGKQIRAHRVSYQEHVGEIPEGMVIRHKCDNPPCINPDHLEIGTPAQNSADMVSRGRSLRGTKSSAAKLTEPEVRQIRRMHAGGSTRASLARRFGVSSYAIYGVVTGKTWGHLNGR